MSDKQFFDLTGETIESQVADDLFEEIDDLITVIE